MYKRQLHVHSRGLLSCRPDQEVAVYVLSRPEELEQRNVIRQTWGLDTVYWLTKASVFFVVSLPLETESQGIHQVSWFRHEKSIF